MPCASVHVAALSEVESVGRGRVRTVPFVSVVIPVYGSVVVATVSVVVSTVSRGATYGATRLVVMAAEAVIDGIVLAELVADVKPIGLVVVAVTRLPTFAAGDC